MADLPELQRLAPQRPPPPLSPYPTGGGGGGGGADEHATRDYARVDDPPCNPHRQQVPLACAPIK